MRAFLVSGCVVLAYSCSSSNTTVPPDAGTTIPPDAGIDSGVDSGIDSGVDSGPPPLPDAGPIFFGAGDAGPFVYKANGPGVPTLMVDNDNSDNNKGVANPQISVSDLLFTSIVQAPQANLSYNQWVVPSDHSGDSRPNAADLANVVVIVWYTGNNSSTTGNGVMTPAQQSALLSWLNTGPAGKTLGVFSQNYVHDMVPSASWTTVPSDPLLAVLGIAGARDNPKYYTTGGDVPLAGANPFAITGNGGLPRGSTFLVFTAGSPLLVSPANLGVLNMGTVDGGVDTNGTVQVDPTATGTGNIAAAVVVTNRHAGTTSSAQLLYCGFPVENINKPTGADAGIGDFTDFFTALGTYLGL